MALYLEVPMDILVDRAAGRWTCRTCQATYSYRVNPPRQQGVCDLDGGQLYQRADDRLAVVSERIKVYLRETVPVLDYYRERGIRRATIDGTTRHRNAVARDVGLTSSLRRRCGRVSRLPPPGGCLAVCLTASIVDSYQP